MSPSVLEAYRARVTRQDLVFDPAQAEAAARLDGLAETLTTAESSGRSSPLGWLFGARKPDAVRGLYLHGGVGRGKT
ncbi:MAG: cell division protein ZapE, partial [Actinomycetospora chiangmaiensis]|nr:cell division protein ZapE [Actinomycetospora chiangmaiensis]